MGHNPSQTTYIVDDDEAFRSSVELLLKSEGFSVQSYANPVTFLNDLPGLAPGCVLLDGRMPEMDGVKVLEQARPYLVSHPVIVITGFPNIKTAVQIMKSGASDFLEKPFRKLDLLTRLKSAFEKLRYAADEGLEHLEAAERVTTLSKREKQVLFGLLKGLSNKVLAHDLHLSPRTVEMHRANMMKRLGVRNLSEALALGITADLYHCE